MIWYINYQNGGMGQSILAHILYASEQVDINLTTFFEDEGRAHRIQKLNTKSNRLIAFHGYLVTFKNNKIVKSYQLNNYLRNTTNEFKCILNIYATKWYQVLQEYMRFKKLAKKVPIKKHIKELYNITEYSLEMLTITNYNRYKNTYDQCNPIYNLSLEDYLNGNHKILQQVIKHLNWHFNVNKSEKFYNMILQQNKYHLQFIDKLKNIFEKSINEFECEIRCELWEISIILAKICEYYNYNPKLIQWDRYNLELINNNLFLIEIVKGIKKWQNRLT